MTKFIRIVFAIFFLLTGVAEAQHPEKEAAYAEQMRVNDFFDHSKPRLTTKDSTMLYIFSFTALVEKNAKGKAVVKALSATDTVAYTVFPGYKFLETVNYGLFMKNRKSATFIFPVVLQIYGSKGKDFEKFIPPSTYILDIFQNALYKKVAIEDMVYFSPYVLTMNKGSTH